MLLYFTHKLFFLILSFKIFSPRKNVSSWRGYFILKIFSKFRKSQILKKINVVNVAIFLELGILHPLSVVCFAHLASIFRDHKYRGGVSLLLRIGNPAKRGRALTSAYKLLVDISSMTSLPAMCRLVSAVWWMVYPPHSVGPCLAIPVVVLFLKSLRIHGSPRVYTSTKFHVIVHVLYLADVYIQHYVQHFVQRVEKSILNDRETIYLV